MALRGISVVFVAQLKIILRSGTRRWWVSLLLWMPVLPVSEPASAAAQAASLELRVAIETGVNQVKVGSSTRAVVRDGTGRSLGEIAPMNAFVAQAEKGMVALDDWQAGQVWVEPTAGGYVFIGDRWYRGKALVVPSEKGLTAVNHVDLEQYLYSVLGAEMGGNWPQEALKAQAVAARSYALYQRQRGANGVFDLGDTQGWQVYRGIEDESVGTQMAVNATLGQVLTHNGQIIEAVFHSSAGGCTENVEDVWTQALPYLRSVPDYDQGSPVFQWTKAFSASELSGLIPGIGKIESITREKATTCGRIISMHIKGDKGSRTMSGESLRSALSLRSTLFEIKPQLNSVATKNNQAPVPAGFLVSGRGFGHGLGLSQWGAYYLAQRGANYQQILLHYYKNTGLAKIQVQ